MKRSIPLLLCVLLLLGVCPAARAEEGPVSIRSREDMLLLAQDPAGSYELVCDIDMGGEDWTPLPFSGTLNGNGHTLYNLTVRAPGADTVTTFDGNRKEYETVLGGLFSALEKAQIRDLNLVNALVDIETDQHCFIGALAGYAAASTISGCSVTVRSHLTISSVNAGVGGLVGFYVSNEIAGCAVDAELTFTDVNRDQLCEEFLGGVYASGCGDVMECTVRMKGFAEVYGYAHNGGVIGMIKLPRRLRKLSTLARTTVEADISFFEITPSRRAYCAALIGENLAGDCRTVNNKVVSFRRNESREPAPMAPEQCDAPQYAAEITPGDCTSWGYTTYTCAGCGYSYRDSYTRPVHQYEATVTTAPTCTEAGERTFRCALCGDSYTEPVPATGHEYAETDIAPTCTQEGAKVFACIHCDDSYSEPVPAAGHQPGDWVLAQAPQVNAAGEEQRRCLSCGEVLERREVPALPYVYAEKVTLSADALDLNVGQTARLMGELAPEDVTEPSLVFASDCEDVAQALPDGEIRALKPGVATITAVSADGKASASCTVTVSFTPWQWVKHYLLFGWLWE